MEHTPDEQIDSRKTRFSATIDPELLKSIKEHLNSLNNLNETKTSFSEFVSGLFVKYLDSKKE